MLGDVMHQRRHPKHSSRLVDQRSVVPVAGNRAAVLGEVVIRVSSSPILPEQLLPDLVHHLPMLRRNNKTAMLSNRLLLGISKDALRRRIPIRDAEVEIPFHYR